MLYSVSHTHYDPRYNFYNYKSIWVFSSLELANCIIAYKSRNEVWFRDYPDGFKIQAFYINDDKNFEYKLWTTQLYSLYYDAPKEENCIDIGIYSSRKLARQKKEQLLIAGNYKKTNLKIDRIILDLEAWREWFISVKEAMKG